MKTILAIGVSAIMLAGFALAADKSGGAQSPTFSKDVSKILYSRCLECHRPGEAAPMAFRDYKEVRTWAKSINLQEVSRNIPPWDADPHFNKFSNDRHLSDPEIPTVVKCLDADEPEGNAP